MAREQNSKFRILEAFFPGPIEYTRQASSTSAQRSRCLRVLNCGHCITDGWKDGQMHGHLTGFTSHLGRDNSEM